MSVRSEEHTSELQSHLNLVCRLLLEKKKHDRRPGGKARVHTARHARTVHTHQCAPELVPISKTLERQSKVISAHCCLLFFFNDTAPTEIYTLSLHDALPISHNTRTHTPHTLMHTHTHTHTHTHI